jgi:glycosyltransferase involved in cell wall biosynthesis
MRISVLIPVHKSEQCIRETLESVLGQTAPVHEIVVVDDGSTDGTADIVRSFGDSVRYVRQTSQGVSAARNTGIREATGDWIAFLDHDDLMQPRKIEVQAAMIEANPHLICVYTAFAFLYTDGQTKEVPAFAAKDLWPAIRYKTPILPSTAIVKRSALLEVGGFRQVFPEDWNLWFRLIAAYGAASFQETNESLTLYRWWENNASHNFLTIMEGVLQQADELFLADLPPLRRRVWKRKILAKQYYNAALSLRGLKDPRYKGYALKSFLLWPFFGKVVSHERYRGLLHMLLK